MRYLSAWTEDKHLYIQTEYCPGGSLERAVFGNNKTALPPTHDTKTARTGKAVSWPTGLKARALTPCHDGASDMDMTDGLSSLLPLPLCV